MHGGESRGFADPHQRRIEALALELSLSLNPTNCRSLRLGGHHPLGTRPSTSTTVACVLPSLQSPTSTDSGSMGRSVGFRILSDDVTIVEQAIRRGTALLSSMLTPWQCLDAVRTFVFPGLNFMMRCGTLGKDDWQ